MVTVLRSAASHLAYWTGVSPPRPFFGRSSLYSRRPARLVSTGLRSILFRSTSARNRIRHGIRHTAARAGRRLCLSVANGRLRHRRIDYARVSKADGSQSLELQRDALQAAGVDAGHVYHDFASGVRNDRSGFTAKPGH